MKYKAKIFRNARKMSRNMTWPEKRFASLMREMGIRYEKQKVIENKIYDFYLPKYNMLVEVDGNHWHANPVALKEGKLSRVQKRALINDKIKDNLAEAHGYSMERVWESDLKFKYDAVKVRMAKITKMI